MEYKQLMDTSNALIVAVANCLMNMGLDGPLIWTQLSEAFGDSAKGMVDDLKLDVSGSDVKTVTESFAAGLKKLGSCQIVNVVSATDTEIQIDLGECVYAPATAVLRGDNREMIPPCAFTAILASHVSRATGKSCDIQGCMWKPEVNTCSFKIAVE
ncbi:MAG: hypothetical protein ACXACG_00350 [Candidatus Thorarchaeota archaeon]|jgi:hypothetical protein